VLKLCNTYRKSLKSLNDHAVSAYKGINIYLDYNQFNQIKRVNMHDCKCKTEPGITLAELNTQLKIFNFYVPYITPGLNERADQIQLDQAVQENRICLQSLRYGYFKEQALERVSLVSGEGRMIQTGGYKVRDTYSFGFNLADFFSGSNYTIGLLFEVVVNCFKHKHNSKGKLFEMKLMRGSDVHQIVKNFKEYVDQKDEKQQNLVDAVVISNLNSPDGSITLSAFDFGLNSAASVKDVAAALAKKLQKPQSTSEAELDLGFVQSFAFDSAKNGGVDQEVVLTVSLGNGALFLEEYAEMFGLPFQLHLLRKYVHVKLCFNSADEQHRVLLDRVTSEAVRIGGTVKASRKTLTTISPFLDKRVLGNYNMKVHNGLKQTFDPRDVLNPSSIFYLREKQEKSAFQRLMDKNKQVNYMFSK